MSLFGSIQLASGAMRANDIALQVVGQNIANANTPGYLREDVQLSPATTQRIGNLELGTGVQVDTVIQHVDNFLEERLRGAVSDSANASAQQNTYQELEGVLGSLGSNSTSTLMTSFFSSISNVLNQPTDTSARNLAVLQGQTLTQNINHLASQVSTMRGDLNNQVIGSATDINRLIDQVRTLNVQIENIGGGDSNSTAVGLSDQRVQALKDLAKLINIHVEAQPSGAVNVYCGSNFLVSEGNAQHVDVVLDTTPGLATASLNIAGNDAPLDLASGQVYGLIQARDQVLGGTLDKLDNFAKTFINEFNKVYSSGQGLSGFGNLTSEFAVSDANAALNKAGLTYTPGSGSFQILVHDKTTGLTQTTNIAVNLTGAGQQTSLAKLAAQINTVNGLSATVTSAGKLQIQATSSDDEFSFAQDSSGVLAALGVNTFFTGSGALDMGVSQAVHDDPSTFAASQSGIGQDTQNAVTLAGFADRPLASQNGTSITGVYSTLINDVTQQSAMASSQADSSSSFQTALESQETAISGVNLDEEAVKMISFQRSFQASAKYVATLNQLFDVLVQL